jgi:hypothetical protein
MSETPRRARAGGTSGLVRAGRAAIVAVLPTFTHTPEVFHGR